nr:hypothetical protein GCM10025699_67350 [Microbacterium flavescens]
MDECIHGFERELCDICAPRKREPQVDADGQVKTLPTKRRAASRKPESLRSTPALARDSAASAVAAQSAMTPVPEFAQQRVYHWTHVSNLPAILESGELTAGAAPVLDVSSEATRALRASVTAASGAPVADHVPFSLSPHASAWDTLRTGAEGYEWSDAARTAKATDFVMLVVPVSALGEEFVITEGDAAVQGSVPQPASTTPRAWCGGSRWPTPICSSPRCSSRPASRSTPSRSSACRTTRSATRSRASSPTPADTRRASRCTRPGSGPRPSSRPDRRGAASAEEARAASRKSRDTPGLQQMQACGKIV